MECLQNRIGLMGWSGNITPSPVLLINQLPGINLDNISALVDEEQADLSKLWEDVVLRTLKKFDVLVKTAINKCYCISDKEIIECLVCKNVELFDVALWYLHGAELMIERTSTDEMSRFTTIDLEKAEKLKEDFYYEFESALKDAISCINVRDADCVDGCIEKVEQVKWVMQTP